jgi:hypothetical protein
VKKLASARKSKDSKTTELQHEDYQAIETNSRKPDKSNGEKRKLYIESPEFKNMQQRQNNRSNKSANKNSSYISGSSKYEEGKNLTI